MKTQKLGSGSGFGRRTLAVEALERRAMLAGNVSVSVSGGNLIVKGDNSDNLVVIEQVGDGEYAVSGFDFDDGDLAGLRQGGPTRINGDANGTEFVEGVTGDIIVDLKKGNDSLAIGNSVDDLISLADGCGFGLGLGSGSGSSNGSDFPSIQQVEPREGQFFVPRNLVVLGADGTDNIAMIADVKDDAVINTGKGNDNVAVGGSFELETDSNIGDDLVILTGAGHDNVCVEFVTVHSAIDIQTADGDDFVEVDEFDAASIVVVTGNGNDFVDLDDFDTDYSVVVNTGAGNDIAFVDDFSAGQGFGPNEAEGAGFVTVVTGAGNDEAEVTDFEADGVTVDTGAGNDGTAGDESPITVADAEISGFLTIVTGAGNDLVLVEFVEAGNVVVNTGAGNDGTDDFPVEIYNVLFENLTVVTGEGSDFLYIHAGNGDDNSEIENNLVVTTAGGNDVVQIIEQVIGNDLIVNVGAGNDLLAIGVDDEIGDGEVDTGMTVEHNLVVDAGAGTDLVAIGFIEVLNDMFAYLGAGNDLMFFGDSEVGRNLLIDAGAGNDDVAVFDNFVEGDTNIYMGSGNDLLAIFDNDFDGKLRLFGGPGNDELDNDLGIESNGIDGNIEVFQFEEFFED